MSPLLAGLESQLFRLTEVSVQGASVSLACWVGIPVYLVLIVSFLNH